MKKVLILFLLGMAVTANAGLIIVVNIGDGLWAEFAESKLTIVPSDEILVGIIDLTGQPQPGSLALGLTDGLGSFNAGSIVTYQGVTSMMTDNAVAAEGYGLQNPFISTEIPGLTNMGQLLTSVVFHCEGPGDVELAIVDNDGQIVDTQVIHQIPEPATLVLLGLGGLLMRKRR
jgi:hypothetical protein